MITVALKHRLGNQMFQIASTIGIAIKHGFDYGFDWDIFQLPKKDSSLFVTVKVPWGYHNVEIHDNTILDGYMQSEKYFNHCSVLIKKLFNIQSSLILPDEYTALHYRGGDYKGNACHNILTKNYWEDAISMVDNNIIIVTDDIPYAKKMFGNRFEIVSNAIFDDLYILTQATSVIMSNSTFSWWGAWLSNADTIISPKQWFGGRKKQWDTEDIYCNNWIRI